MVIVIRTVVICGGWELTRRGHKETSGMMELFYFDWGIGHMHAYICSNSSNYTLKINAFFLSMKCILVLKKRVLSIFSP